MKRRRGLLIAFSGLDGAGKSSQIELLMERLAREGQKLVYLWTRGGYTPHFEYLKVLLRRLLGRAVPPSGHSLQRSRALRKGWIRRLWLVLALSDLSWVYGVQVRWWRWRGRTVICDRYLWDTLVDLRLNFAQDQVEQWWLWRFLVRVTPQPDAAFLMLVPVEESVRRSDAKGEPFRDSSEVLARRLAEYEALAQRGQWQVMDGRLSSSDLASQIREVVDICGRK